MIAETKNISQQTFQRGFNVVFRLIWRRDITQRQINIETTLCTSTLNNVESTLYISTLIWTTLDNVETTLWIWRFEKKKLSLDSKVKWYFWASNNTLDSKCSSFYCPFSEEYVKEDLQGRKILKTWNILNYKNYKPSHFVKYQLVFNLTRRQVQTS